MFQVKVEKNVQYICNDCFEKVSQWLRFKTMCLRSNIIYEEKLKLSKKENLIYQSNISKFDESDITQNTETKYVNIIVKL